MEKSIWSVKRIFEFPKMTTKRICMIGLLIAVTFVLSAVSGYLRIGNISKLSVSFISVFVAAYAFGGIVGGVVGAAADIISYAVNPIGAFLPQLTLVEFIFGFVFGFIFHRTGQKNYLPKVLILDILMFAINMILKTFILAATFKLDFITMFISRLPMCAVQAVIVFAVLILIKPFLPKFLKLTGEAGGKNGF